MTRPMQSQDSSRAMIANHIANRNFKFTVKTKDIHCMNNSSRYIPLIRKSVDDSSGSGKAFKMSRYNLNS